MVFISISVGFVREKQKKKLQTAKTANIQQSIEQKVVIILVKCGQEREEKKKKYD
jgi:hypothetical protein